MVTFRVTAGSICAPQGVARSGQPSRFFERRVWLSGVAFQSGAEDACEVERQDPRAWHSSSGRLEVLNQDQHMRMRAARVRTARPALELPAEKYSRERKISESTCFRVPGLTSINLLLFGFRRTLKILRQNREELVYRSDDFFL